MNNNIFTERKIPVVIQIPIYSNIENEAPSSYYAGSKEAQEEVTLQDLQAMKQMIKEIRQNPELLYTYSQIFSHSPKAIERLPPLISAAVSII
eukprot:CAMPEP_0181119892 /NCGR_PEP_ID=MMETSP1071-20121207/23841_1 /TAXON_ID=35127 /ORGANISM="Thalassiosira sp., Strain NH16" /LENGTH=92 /DNA_ID=CAMNT_0023204463 /DNA_START=163 /DNA_END=441 /DNA_ORIENTATION=-